MTETPMEDLVIVGIAANLDMVGSRNKVKVRVVPFTLSVKVVVALVLFRMVVWVLIILDRFMDLMAGQSILILLLEILTITITPLMLHSGNVRLNGLPNVKRKKAINK